MCVCVCERERDRGVWERNDDKGVTITWVACMSCSQCLSLIAWFCSSPTALSDVTMFLTVESSPLKVSQALISLSSIRMSFTNFLHSISMFSTLMSFQRVVFQSINVLCTRWIMSQSILSSLISRRHVCSCLNSGTLTSNKPAPSLRPFISASIVLIWQEICTDKSY